MKEIINDKEKNVVILDSVTDGDVDSNESGIHKHVKVTHSLRSRVPRWKKDFARKLRKNPTPVYKKIWSRLRKDQLGVRFKRRSILLGWIPDFWCPSQRIAIDIDYKSDSNRLKELEFRDSILDKNGIRMLRFSSDQICENIEAVVQEIRGHIVTDRSKKLRYKNK